MPGLGAKRHCRSVTAVTDIEAATEDTEVLTREHSPTERTVMTARNQLPGTPTASPLGSLQMDPPPPTYYRYELKNVMISSYDVSGAGQSE